MKEKCTLCGHDTDNLYHIAEQYVLDTIKSEHLDWVDKDGACLKCVKYYKALDNAVLIEA